MKISLIPVDLLRRWVQESLRDNPHKDPVVKVNHRQEHEHFLHLIDKCPPVELNACVYKYNGYIDRGNTCYETYKCQECGHVYVMFDDKEPIFCTGCGKLIIVEKEGS